MITVCLLGRLGNQLFQYALALSLSKKYNTFYVIDDSLYKDGVKKYFESIQIADNKYVRRLMRAYFDSKRLGVIEQNGYEQLSDVQSLIRDNAYYSGYFQSTQYFENISSTLKNVFKIKKNYKKDFSDKYTQLFDENKTLVIHCRIGDYAIWGSEMLGGTNLVLPAEYYKNALALISDIDIYKIIVVTDDIAGAENILSFVSQKLVVSDQEIVDFQLLMHADKLIISNSTFAWWAAYLNIKNAQVYAPEHWIGFKIGKEYPIGISNNSFKKVLF
jgi:hypothetical protein